MPAKPKSYTYGRNIAGQGLTMASARDDAIAVADAALDHVAQDPIIVGAGKYTRIAKPTKFGWSSGFVWRSGPPSFNTSYNATRREAIYNEMNHCCQLAYADLDTTKTDADAETLTRESWCMWLAYEAEPDDVNRCVTDVLERRRWNRAYREAKALGMDDQESHRLACGI